MEFSVGASDLLLCGVISTEAFEEDVCVVVTPSFIRSLALAMAEPRFSWWCPPAPLPRFDFFPFPPLLWARLTTTTFVTFLECVVLLLPVSELLADWSLGVDVWAAAAGPVY